MNRKVIVSELLLCLTLAGAAMAESGSAPADTAASGPANGSTAAAAEKPTMAAGEKDDPWASFNLAEMMVGDTRLRYDKVFADDLEAIRSEVEAYRQVHAASLATIEQLRENSTRILETINSALGIKPDEKLKAEQRERLDVCIQGSQAAVAAFSPAKGTIVVVPRDRVKAFLRQGGSLPGFSYDRVTDQCQYRYWVVKESGSSSGPAPLDMALPLDPANAREEARGWLSNVIPQWGWLAAGLVIHEASEAAIVQDRLGCQHQHSRWFTDGFANAVTIHVLRTVFGDREAGECAAAYDLRKHESLRREVNLRYWLAAASEIDLPSGLEHEAAIKSARYAFATAEARGLIERHGLEVVAKVLDKVAGKKATGNDLAAAVTAVTGEDMAARLAEYQSFTIAPAEEAVRCVQAALVAEKRGDTLAALSAMLRATELVPAEDPNHYQATALLLHRLDWQPEADRVFLKFAEKADDARSRTAWHRQFILFASRVGDLRRAAPYAKDVLKSFPSDVTALTVIMYVESLNGNRGAAAEAARRIILADAAGGLDKSGD